MKSPKTREDLIEIVVQQLKVDLHCNDTEAIEELVRFLPEEDWKQFKHLRDEKDNNP